MYRVSTVFALGNSTLDNISLHSSNPYKVNNSSRTIIPILFYSRTGQHNSNSNNSTLDYSICPGHYFDARQYLQFSGLEHSLFSKLHGNQHYYSELQNLLIKCFIPRHIQEDISVYVQNLKTAQVPVLILSNWECSELKKCPNRFLPSLQHVPIVEYIVYSKLSKVYIHTHHNARLLIFISFREFSWVEFSGWSRPRWSSLG